MMFEQLYSILHKIKTDPETKKKRRKVHHPDGQSIPWPLLEGIVFILYLVLFFSHPIYSFRPSFYLSLLIVTQIRGQVAALFSPPPRYGSCLEFLSREDLSSLVNSRRLVIKNTHTK